MKIELTSFGGRAAMILTVETDEERRVLKQVLYPNSEIPRLSDTLRVCGGGSSGEEVECVVLVKLEPGTCWSPGRD